MGRVILGLLRVLQALLAAASLGLSGYVVNWYLTETDFAPPATFNFHLFAPAFSLVSIACLELVPRLAPRASRPWASLTVEIINTLFYFGGFIALAMFLSRLRFCFGAVCAVARADSVVAAAEFSAWIASAILVAKDILFKRGFTKPVEAAPQMAPQMGEQTRQQTTEQRGAPRVSQVGKAY